MTTDAVSAARLAVFLAFLPLSLFCLFKHGKTSFLGWFYVQAFCILRIVTGGMGLHGDQTGQTYVILNSIGLSPLILSTAGILHEARRATNPRLNRKLNFTLVVKFHGLVSAGMVLIIVAIVNYMGGDTSSDNKTLLDAGSALNCVTWGILMLWAVFSFYQAKASSVPESQEAMRGGRALLTVAFWVLPIIALRLGYGVAYLQLIVSDPTSEFLTSTAASVCLSVVPEMIIVAILLWGGLTTRSLKHDLHQRDKGLAMESLA